MHGEGNVVVDAADVSVAIPAVADIEAFELLKILPRQAAVEIGTETIERDIDEDPEEFPIVVGIVELPGMLEIGDDIAAGARIERLPDLFRHQRQGKTERRKLDHPLIAAIDRSPIFGMGRICAVCETFGKTMPVGEVAVAGAKRRQSPERAGEPFQIGRRPVEMGAAAIERDAGIAVRETGKQRIEERKQGAAHIGAGFQRIAGERVGAGGIIGHRYHSRVLEHDAEKCERFSDDIML